MIQLLNHVILSNNKSFICYMYNNYIKEIKNIGIPQVELEMSD